MASELQSDLQDTADCSRKWFVGFNGGKTQLVLLDQSNKSGAIDKKMDGSILEEKRSFKMLGLSLSSKLDWGFISIAKTAPKQIGASTSSMKYISPKVAFYLNKSTTKLLLPCLSWCS